jgi:hypothetical protein
MTTFNESVAGSLGFSGDSRRLFATQYPVAPPHTLAEKERIKFFADIVKKFSLLSGVGTPLGTVAPRWVGDRFLDTSKYEWYFSHGITESDWKKVTT